jgi:hypothetical protein
MYRVPLAVPDYILVETVLYFISFYQNGGDLRLYHMIHTIVLLLSSKEYQIIINHGSQRVDTKINHLKKGNDT